MRLEEGKYYKTKEGRKVKCIAVSTQDDGKKYGALCESFDSSLLHIYTVDGRYYHRKDSDFDIVAEWKEPKKYKVTVALWSDGEVTTSKEGAFNVRNARGGGLADFYIIGVRTIEWETEE